MGVIEYDQNKYNEYIPKINDISKIKIPGITKQDIKQKE